MGIELADNIFDDDFWERISDDPGTDENINEMQDRNKQIKDNIIMIMNESYWEDDLFTEKKDFLTSLDDEYIARVTVETKTPEFTFMLDDELNKLFIK